MYLYKLLSISCLHLGSLHPWISLLNTWTWCNSEIPTLFQTSGDFWPPQRSEFSGGLMSVRMRYSKALKCLPHTLFVRSYYKVGVTEIGENEFLIFQHCESQTFTVWKSRQKYIRFFHQINVFTKEVTKYVVDFTEILERNRV